jgi:hypothetical protein
MYGTERLGHFPSPLACHLSSPSRHRHGLSHRENRAALFASSAPSSGRNSPLPMHYPKNLQGYAATRTAEDLEGQNNEHLEGLSAKVKLLKDVSPACLQHWNRAADCGGAKQITINIGNEVRDSTKMLSGMVRRVPLVCSPRLSDSAVDRMIHSPKRAAFFAAR